MANIHLVSSVLVSKLIKIYKDVLIYHNNYKLTKLDKMFIEVLKETIRDLYGK